MPLVKEQREKQSEKTQSDMEKLLQIWVAFGTLAFLAVSAVAEDVVVLTEANFEKEVGQDRGSLVEFYAPWYPFDSILLIICFSY